MQRKIRKLKDVIVKEISLVDVPAVQKFLLFKRAGGITTDITDSVDEELVNAEFNAMPPEEQIEFLERMKRLAAKIDALEMANLPPLQKAALIDTMLLQEGLERLYKRDPGLFRELIGADTDALQKDWLYERDARGVPIIMKRVKRTYEPGETVTHRFGELPDGRWGWAPKNQGRR